VAIIYRLTGEMVEIATIFYGSRDYAAIYRRAEPDADDQDQAAMRWSPVGRTRIVLASEDAYSSTCRDGWPGQAGP
jgi:hypothetical protein